MNTETIIIGSSRKFKVPSLVLEYTILKHASRPFNIIHTYNKIFPDTIKLDALRHSGFSFNRFAIPEMVGYNGRAAYLECDQIVFADVAELFDIPMNNATVLRTIDQTSVLILDCTKLKWNLNDIINDLNQRKYTYDALSKRLFIEPAENIVYAIPEIWNSLEHFEEGQTKLLHYTNMWSQPWVAPNHPLAYLWMKELKEAVNKGNIPIETVAEDTNLGYLIPEILKELKND